MRICSECIVIQVRIIMEHATELNQQQSYVAVSGFISLQIVFLKQCVSLIYILIPRLF